MRVLLTGATGTAGRAILRRLLEAGFGPMYGTYRSDPSPEYLADFAAPLADGRLRLHCLDLAVLTPDQGPAVDAVVHCAARRPASRCAADPEAAARDNVQAVERLVSWSRQRGVGLFIHFSIHSVYAEGRAPHQESDPVRPTDLQVAAKLESEAIVAQGCGDALHHLILRLPHFHGADLPPDGVVAAFARAGAAGELRLAGDGNQTVCFIELRDLADLIAILLAEPPPSGIYNAASETLSVRALAEGFQQAWRDRGGPVPRLRIQGGPQPSNYGLDCGKLLAATPWHPRYMLQERLGSLI